MTIRTSGHRFEVNDREAILAGSMRAGLVLPYGCRNGACGSCKGQVIDGRVTHGPHSSAVLSPEEQARGFALFCCAFPETDTVIEVREISGAGMFPVRKMPCRVAKIDRVSPDVVVVKLQLPSSERLQYRAGQYVDFLLRDGKRRSYSMATEPGHADQLEIHIRHTPGGTFTDHVFGAGTSTLKERDILRLEGPFGVFFLRDDSDKPIIFLASGTGIAPIKAIIEEARVRASTRAMTLYWGGRRPDDLYLGDLAQQWARELGTFQYIPVVSDAEPEDHWTGRDGFVHRAVMEDHPDLSAYQVYACGAPIVIDSARRDFTSQCGLPEDEFFSDAFTTEADAGHGEP